MACVCSRLNSERKQREVNARVKNRILLLGSLFENLNRTSNELIMKTGRRMPVERW